jgi:spermidine/putrescine transport system permease protein
VEALRDFTKRYGIAMTTYMLVACAVWMLGMIILPQVLMVDYSFWHEEKAEQSKIDQRIEVLYIDLQKVQSKIRGIKRQQAQPQGQPTADPFTGKVADPATLAADRIALEAREGEFQGKIAELEKTMVTPEPIYGLRNYIYLFTNELHRAIFFKTIWSSVLVTLTALVLCYPIAFYLAKVAPVERAGLLMLGLIVPYWINEILRTFAWLMILAYNGVFNSVFTGLGVIDQPIEFLDGNLGVLIGMTYAYILFMVFPMYNTMETLDKNQIEAARDLGASWWRIHWRIVIPHAKPGIAVGCIMTFMLAAGSYAVPQILGGKTSLWFTQIIYNWFFEGGDWNLGSAYAFLLLTICILFILFMMRVFKVKLQDIAK